MYSLVLPSILWENQHMDYLAACRDAGDDDLTPSAASLKGCKDFAEFLRMTEARSVEPEDDWVPSTLYYFTDGEQLLGMVDFRHYLNDSLQKVGGHIGYSLHPAVRGQGLANKMLAMAVREGHRRGFAQLLLTCYKENTRSALTIQHCGGVLADEFMLESSMRMVQRYWVPTGL